ncbi:MAG: class C sortase [Lactobacillales bacterium]|jgi:sortase A|nr:class C sortase [Lactobacillales bacterium]
MAKFEKVKLSKRIKRFFNNFGILFLFIAGAAIFMYPFVTDGINTLLDDAVIKMYQNEQKAKDVTEIQTLRQEIDARNKELREKGIAPGVDPFKEKETIPVERPLETFYAKHTVGIVHIPKINVRLPIFDMAISTFLDKGAGLVEGSSYPVGGLGTHTVISAHRGLPTARLFTDIDDLKNGDVFILEVMGDHLAYQVDKISIVEPSDNSKIRITDNKDYATLLTCTPYMINSHRLLVRGHRIPYTASMERMMKRSDNNRYLWLIAVLIGSIAIIAFIIYMTFATIRKAILRRRHIDLELFVMDKYNDIPSSLAFTLTHSASKKPLRRDGKEVVLTPDESGRLALKEVPAANYKLRAKNMKPIKVQFKKLKQTDFNYKGNKKIYQIDDNKFVVNPIFE